MQDASGVESGKRPYRSELEDAVARVSRMLIARPDGAVEEALEILGTAIDVSRACVMILDEAARRLDCTYLWDAGPDFAIDRASLSMGLVEFPWGAQCVSEGTIANIPDLSIIPPEASEGRAVLASMGVKSGLGIPMYFSGRVLGMLRFHDVKRARQWTQHEQSMLSIAADCIAAYISSSENRRRSESIPRAILDAMPDPMFSLSRDGVLLHINRREHIEFYAPAAEFIGKSITEMLPEPAYRMIFDALNNAFLTRQIQTLEYTLNLYDHELTYETRIVPCADDTAIAIVRNVTERAQTDSMLRMQTSAITASSQTVMICDTEGLIEYVNPAFEQDTGYTLAELRGKSPSVLRPEDYSPDVYRELWSTIRSGRTWEGEVGNRRKDGSFLTRELFITPVKNQKGEIERFISVGRDVTAKRAYDEQMIRSQKIEMVGRMAAGISHDFNNILQGILGCTRMMIRRGEFTPKQCEDLKEVEQAAVRGSQLVKRIMAFARQVPSHVEPVDITALAQEATGLLRQTLPRAIRIECTAAPACDTVMADATQVHQVLMNLCLNARDAMKDGGVLTVCVDQVEIDRDFVRSNQWARTGDFVRCIVADEGCGMPASVRERAFEPFFTTKPPDEGSGLGLSVCYGIIQSHGGFINIQSKVGEGSTVTFYLPVSRVAASAQSSLYSNDELRGSETILVVDDEQSILKFAGRLLEEMGYKVRTASDGMQAVDMAAEPTSKLDLMLLDLNMPHMGGLKALGRIREMLPRLKVIVTTGMDTGAMDLPPNYRPDALIMKPYQPEDLLREIRALLNK